MMTRGRTVTNRFIQRLLDSSDLVETSTFSFSAYFCSWAMVTSLSRTELSKLVVELALCPPKEKPVVELDDTGCALR